MQLSGKNWKWGAALVSVILHLVILMGLVISSSAPSAQNQWRGGGRGHVTVITLVDDIIADETGNSVVPTTDLSQSKNILKTQKAPPSAVISPPISKKPHQNFSNGTLGPGLDPTGPDAVTPPTVLASIRKLIDKHKTYPAQAQNGGVSGRVSVNFAIDMEGSLRYVTVVKSSGSAILDAAAIDAIKKAVPFPYIASPITLALDYQLDE